jgi:hypothetical protein
MQRPEPLRGGVLADDMVGVEPLMLPALCFSMLQNAAISTSGHTKRQGTLSTNQLTQPTECATCSALSVALAVNVFCLL